MSKEMWPIYSNIVPSAESLGSHWQKLLVLHEELGGDPSKITVLTRTGEEVICSSVSEDDPPPLDSWKLNNAKYFTSHQSQPELRLACSDERGLISSINFASFGNPRGNCGSYVPGDCHADMSSFVRKACLGKKGCSIPLKRVSRELGNDHCPGLVKRVAVEAVCS